ncbi:RING-H2 finger protein ATL65 [Argentina anserina]|uniref:RING-H2 finger protein ATL65 n=1 Tax=Argentina anserina TaxID=57926 RepID=UPI0021768875|nr:RING-H2 finger protein ATL65 [Potentilla anserina]
MGLIVVDSISSSDLFVGDVLYKAAFVIAVLRWAFYWALRLRRRLLSDEDEDSGLFHAELDACTTSPSSSSSQLIRDSLIRTTFEEVTRRQGKNSCRVDTCAVCLSQLEMGDEVRELRNCCHVFHTECIDRWLDYNGRDGHDHGAGAGSEDNHKTCPLCRMPLLTSSQIESLSWEQRAQPSWAVERLLYLFGEDLVL